MAQCRAARTRQALVHAAAEEFDRLGYHGASLSAISQTIGMSLGALTFHFPAKDRLVEAVHALGATLTQREVARTEALTGCPLLRARAVLVAVTGLLRTEVVVRAAARLAVERPCPGYDWTATWVPALGTLLEEAHDTGCLRPEPAPREVTALAVGLVAALVPGPTAWAGDLVDEEKAVLLWDLLVSALQPEGRPRPDGPGGPPATGPRCCGRPCEDRRAMVPHGLGDTAETY
ncbi:helix-turn-helix domain-containing protein [Streptomyces sp. NPDC004539]|uniref:helix-turn-helix domain-containing protein n=1 Tax=Streptomyces sp. NPDC004539 TaxID=3154280 RepID=UPI0033AD2595